MYLEKIGFWVSIFFHPPGYSVDAQTRKLVHEKNTYLKKFGFYEKWANFPLWNFVGLMQKML